MKKVGKTKAQERKSESYNGALVCFFCDSPIEAGEEIISGKHKGYYHRRCYDFLFTLKRGQIISKKEWVLNSNFDF
jgi:hypothetical protein